MPGFRRRAEATLLRAPIFEVVEGRFEGPGGEEFTRSYLRHPGAVAVVPLVDEDHALLVRQYRAAIDREILEIPAGKRDVAGEPVEVAAARELEEEVGYRAGWMELAATFFNSCGITDEYTYLFLARDLTEVGVDLQGVEEQHMTIERIALVEVPGRIAGGELADAKTIIGLTLALGARR